MWTPERIATLRRLRLAGLSASKIAQQLGGVSRSAVIGKAYRLGLCRPKTCIRKPPIQKKQNRGRANGFAVLSLDMRAQRLDRLKTCRSFETEAKPSVFCTLMELTEDRCRWPIGEPGLETVVYCGEVREIGAYCAAHARIAYVSMKREEE